MRTTEHLASLLKDIEESRRRNRTYLNQYKSGVGRLAQQLEQLETKLIESQFKFENLANTEPFKLRNLYFNLAQTG